jgi:serine/threonine protein kinase
MAIKQKNVIHRDLKLPNVLLHFKKLPVEYLKIKA